ncbi:MAG TPA: RluA family pseudouridine synthase [Candidatus Saccharimonadales bacterium]|nr:RluA family pseudouridine synthase [Candidatus Saccharimonadales bacterium]
MDSLDAQRLDLKVVELLPQLSRSSAEKLIETGKVEVNGRVVDKSSYKIRPTDKVKVDYDFGALKKIPAIKLKVLYEDEDCVVVSKPVGVLTHSKGAFNPEATVATWLAARVKDLSGERAGIVHRLDRATSGVMICAKTPEALAWLQKQFSSRKVKKIYVAIIEGQLKEERAIIDMPIERNPKRPQTFRVGANGKSAITQYEVSRSNGKLSLVELSPQTGRTHQLRVHLAQLGHPIVGDNLYGGKPAERLFLHALSLETTLPNRERKIFRTTLPLEFGRKMREL